MTTRTVAIALVASLALAGSSYAGSRVNARQRHQHHRIAQGVRSGELTGRELRRLERQQGRIRREEFRYRHNDGRLGPWERRDLQRDLGRASRNIDRQKHDAQRR